MQPTHFNPGSYPGKSLHFSDLDNAWSIIYYVTLCTEYRDPIFEIPELRQILEETWPPLLKKFPHVTLDEFIIMSDHIQFILWLDNAREDSPTLADVIAAYKSLAASAWLRHMQAADLVCQSQFFCQGNYFERIIASDEELVMTRSYIRTSLIRRQISG